MLDACHVDAAHGPPCEVWDNSGQADPRRVHAYLLGVVYRGYSDGPSDVVCCTGSEPVLPPSAPPKGSAAPGPLEHALGST
ncbi:MAG TPA: hypothetical protein VH143_02130 [Kofleriaceae bacterium]|nr:hypothetical protein [Kofleriaceae bacterium]